MLATNLPLPPRRLQLPVALRVDLLLPPSQHVLRCDVARSGEDRIRLVGGLSAIGAGLDSAKVAFSARDIVLLSG